MHIGRFWYVAVVHSGFDEFVGLWAVLRTTRLFDRSEWLVPTEMIRSGLGTPEDPPILTLQKGRNWTEITASDGWTEPATLLANQYKEDEAVRVLQSQRQERSGQTLYVLAGKVVLKPVPAAPVG